MMPMTLDIPSDSTGIDHIDGTTIIRFNADPLDIPTGVDPPRTICECPCHNINSNVSRALDGAIIPVSIICVECRCWD